MNAELPVFGTLNNNYVTSIYVLRAKQATLCINEFYRKLCNFSAQ